MNVSRGIIERLVANGVDTVFGIPGKQTLPLNDAIGARDDVRFVVARHETAVSHQRGATRRPAVRWRRRPSSPDREI